MAKAIDPITFEIIRHKLFGVVDEAVFALKNVSGTAITSEMQDLMVALYRKDGSLLVAGLGFLYHMTSAMQAIKHLIANYSEDPGIFEDDLYLFNDSYTGALHAPDVYLISPIYWNGKLSGFVANFVHVTDIGAIDPGGFCPSAKESYQEGFMTRGLKLIERGKIRKDVMDTILNLVRDPGMVGLDLKSQMAANHVAKERMHKLYQDYGFEIVDAVSSELIEQSEQLFRKRLLDIPDGVWKARHYYDLPDVIYRIQLTATKKLDTLTYDFTGTSEQASWGINCSYWACLGGMFAPIYPLLAWDIPWNEGITRCVKLIAPEGTLVNARRPAPVSIATTGVMQCINVVSTTVISKMLGATEKYKNHVTAIWKGASINYTMAGVNANGEYVVFSPSEGVATGGGAKSSKDAVDLGGDIINPVMKPPSTERIELYNLHLNLFRRVLADTGGPGKYRGSVSQEMASISHGSPAHGFKAMILANKGIDAPLGYGIFGGYPACNSEQIQFRESNAQELPRDFSSIKAKKTDNIRHGVTDITENDILYQRHSGGGGYGDPLDREPELVLKDVLNGLVTNGPARDVYGVVLDLDSKRVDSEATHRLRLSIRQNRLNGKRLKVKTSVRRNIPSTGSRINEYLQVADSKGTTFVQCTWCGENICPSDGNWKEHVISRKSSPTVSGPFRKDSGLFFLLEFFCPGCATVLDVDVVLKDDPPLYDKIHKWVT